NSELRHKQCWPGKWHFCGAPSEAGAGGARRGWNAPFSFGNAGRQSANLAPGTPDSAYRVLSLSTGQSMKANTHSITMLTMGTSDNRENAPLNPALLTMRQTGTR